MHSSALFQVPFAGTGLFCRVKVEPNTVLAFYNGKRLRPRSWEDVDHPDWAENAYKIFDPTMKNQTIDIPKPFRYAPFSPMICEIFC